MSHPRDILLQLGASARKSMSQNFLTSPHWAERLTHLLVQPSEADEYWEIGPGLGALTSKLIDMTAKPIHAFEYDRKLAGYLRARFPSINVIEGDFLEQDIKEISASAKQIAVLSNLPYHLSSSILFQLLEQKERFSRLVLTFQREFAERLYARPRTHDYGALSVIAQIHFKIESIGILPPGAFYPVPAVSSEALLLEPICPVPYGAFYINQVVKAAFAQRRKKLSSNLKRAFPNLPIESIMERLGLSLSMRPEELSKEEYIALTSQLKSPG